jgi:hypothetical protein
MANNGNYSRKTIDITEIHSNIEQKLIQITEDRLTLILNQHIKNLEMKNAWVAPLGILITLIVVFATTEFKKAFVSADTWRAFFIISTLLTIYWLIKSLITAFKAESINEIVDKIKQGDI